MYAVVEILGHQYKVEKDKKIFVNRLNEDEGRKIIFENVLLVDDSKKVNIGTPFVKDARVEAKILQHLKSDKVIVFNKNRRKGYRVKNGHRQHISQIEISSIVMTASKPKIAVKKVETKKPTIVKKAITSKKAVASKTTK